MRTLQLNWIETLQVIHDFAQLHVIAIDFNLLVFVENCKEIIIMNWIELCPILVYLSFPRDLTSQSSRKRIWLPGIVNPGVHDSHSCDLILNHLRCESWIELLIRVTQKTWIQTYKIERTINYAQFQY